MLYFFTPYSLQRKLLDAYDHYLNLVNDDDWVCFTDGDTAFLCSDFGHKIDQYITKYPDTGLFTSYASRCFYPYQVPGAVNQQNDSIRYHKQIANTHNQVQHLNVNEINLRIAGHLMAIKKSTWLKIRDQVYEKAKYETIEGVDTAISNAILSNGMKIRLMKSIYIFHYFRLIEGVPNKKHLGYGHVINIITPCARPENLKALAQSINMPKAAYKWWVVFDLDPSQVKSSDIPQYATPLYHRNPKSVVGHAQRNHALDQIKSGYVFFLDDDTIIHPDLYITVNHLPHDFIHFDQAHADGTKRIGGKVEVNHIDTGSAMATRELIGNTRFRTDLYNADGYFWKAISQKAKSPHYIPKLLSYYNYLTQEPAEAV